MTNQEMLDQVQTAISDILTKGQSFAINNRRLDRANLEDLQKREEVLLARVGRESRGGIRVRRVTPI